jgi:hypothetical protein
MATDMHAVHYIEKALDGQPPGPDEALCPQYGVEPPLRSIAVAR